MLPTVFPFPLIWFQFFFLLIAIAIEAYVFFKLLKFGRRKALFYSVFINLTSTIMGWLFFFFILPFLSENIKLKILSYIFFEKLFSSPEYSLNTAVALVIIATFIFFSSLFLKFRTFQILQIFFVNQQIDYLKEPLEIALIKIILFGSPSLSHKKLIKSKKKQAVIFPVIAAFFRLS
ncbi:MAG: hypothetical protein N3E45_10005 [Oscillatoriaceae bacterium SKW80]|nr:hypothetical protein [Oscillatoriaceae bacterium SKYG93]MCX8121149.1 hypothetical protein [Oscillatoriaceae bacterium SKW80]MDW8453521.1 hypothetical protein [Oscillatoriaceae cyanobacterium SKYGB_i_bin93]HIK26871.1 hypothetical protein [Oscillatoriaceae cyanobacterium M7585_C2015_266]